MHQISMYLAEHNCYFTPYYADGIIKQLSEMGLLNFTILGGKFKVKLPGIFFQIA